MRRPLTWLAVLVAGLVVDWAGTNGVANASAALTIVCPGHASPLEKLAAKEIRRYFYLRTGCLPAIADSAREGRAIVVATKDSPLVAELLSDAGTKSTVAALAPEQYVLKSLEGKGGSRVLLVVGGDPIGALYGAYRLTEHLGVRFYMHGDVVPDVQIPLELPLLNETGKPLFALRGIQPFHDFPEGPDWWNRDDYKAIIGQLPKMRMNFFGLHTYPQGGVGPEPAVWIGRPQDLGPDGRVMASYPSRHFATSNITGAWGYRPMKTGDYAFGAASLFDRDDYGADYMRGTQPWNKMSPERSNALFDSCGEALHDALTFARRLGVKTCVGTETPLVIPDSVKQRLKAAGKDPADPAVVQELYEGMFRRIAKTHPVDYYWLWTPEGWTWQGCSEAEIRATQADFRAALAAMDKVKPQFTLATCGWVLGPPQTPALFDNSLPKNMPMSCISRTVGNSPVEPGFRRVEGRPKWSIPWMEDDPGLTIPQLWAGRMRRDAADSLAYGCTGLMGIHWRTRVLAPNVSALAQAAWDQTGWNPDFGKPAELLANNTMEGPEGGSVAAFPHNHIAGTDDAPLYQTVRYNMNSYRFNVPNGSYTVTLKFCEPCYAAKGKRVFGANIQDQPLVKSLDIFARVGQNRAIDLTMKDVRVTNGRLSIEFAHEVEFPCIAAIAIEGTTAGSNQFPGRAFSRKINCGGPAYKDYEADLPARGDGRPRYLPIGDFYRDWARAEFGPEASEAIAAIFARLDGHLPRPADWVTGPGSIRPDGADWQAAKSQYAFVDELAALRPRIIGAGNLDRFDYWLNSFRCLRSIGEVRCVWARYNATVAKVRAEKSPEVRKRLARELALPVRKELVAAFGKLHEHLLATVSNAGELGNVCNWQQQTMPVLLIEPGKELAALLGEPLPPDAEPSKQYLGPPRVVVPTVRTAIAAGETFKLTVLLPGIEPREAALRWRPLGQGEFAQMPLVHVARSVYVVTLPGEATRADFEYHIHVVDGQGQSRHFPATAPKLNQSVIVFEEK
jgi:hypothetical protein